MLSTVEYECFHWEAALFPGSSPDLRRKVPAMAFTVIEERCLYRTKWPGQTCPCSCRDQTPNGMVFRHGLYHTLEDIPFPCVCQSHSLRCDTAESIAAVSHPADFRPAAMSMWFSYSTVAIVSSEREESSGVVDILCIGKADPGALAAPNGYSFTRKLLVEMVEIWKR